MSEREEQILYVNAYTGNLRKTVQMSLFTEKKGSHRRREWTCGRSGEGDGGMN